MELTMEKWSYLEMCASHFHALGGWPVFPGAEHRVEGPDVVEDARHLVVKVGEGEESAAVDVVPEQEENYVRFRKYYT